MVEDLFGRPQVTANHGQEMPVDLQLNPLLPSTTGEGPGWIPTSDDRRLLRTILDLVIRENRPKTATWPTWDYVRLTLRNDPSLTSRPPEDLIADFPHVRNETRQGYGLIWRSDGAAGPIRSEERVGLTIAGLNVVDPDAANALVKLAASYAADESLLKPSPTGVAEDFANFDRAEWMLNLGRRSGVWSMTETAAAEVLLHEHPPLITQSVPGQWVAHLGPTNYYALRDVTTAREYLTIVWDRIRPLNEKQVPMTSTEQPGPRIFLVHGQDNAVKNEVARFLERATASLGGVVTILHEQPNGGRTLIEKFEQEARTSDYAVVLLTPDDRGGPARGKSQPRARQNVIFELGYFAGLIGRERVLVINADVEKPSDIDGLVYIGYPGNWQAEVIRELRRVGIRADVH